jgi:hypothetical protein
MAIHPSIMSMLKESLPEFLLTADYCISFQKGEGFPTEQKGGCLGFPGTSLLFCIADAIGSYYRGNKSFRILVDDKSAFIKNDSFHHFFIFNSQYYGLALSGRIIKKLYDNYRNLLLHNAALAPQHMLFMSDPKGPPFLTDGAKPHVNVVSFLAVSKVAVGSFLRDVEKVVPGSDQENIIQLRK